MTLQNIVVVNADECQLITLQRLSQLNAFRIVSIVDRALSPAGYHFSNEHNIPVTSRLDELEYDDVHIVLCFEDKITQHIQEKYPEVVFLSKQLSLIFMEFVENSSTVLSSLGSDIAAYKAIFNSVEEGMIGINASGIIQYFNDSASKMLQVPAEQAIGQPILSIIPDSGLIEVVKSKKVDSNVELQLSNGLRILSSRYPIQLVDGTVTGAFAVFKDITDIIKTAEEITDLKRVTTMLEAIIYSSEDAISVVDSEGRGILINPAYTRLTGLTEDEVIGEPATVDISSGESIHMKVLETKKPVRGVNMRIGEKNRDVIVNVAPILVDNQVRGSVGVIHDITEMRSLMEQLDRAKATIRDLESSYTFDDIIGNNEELLIAVAQAKIAATSGIPIMLRGEPGTGKELFAHAIHTSSKKSQGDLLRIACSSLTMDSIKMALLHSPDKDETLTGTLFLDEITDLTHDVQKSLLSYLKSGSIIAGEQQEKMAMRVIASSSLNIEHAVHEGILLEELYYELTRISIRIPPLRSRKGDIAELTRVLLAMLNEEFGMTVKSLSNQALLKLQSYDWPGNVRELENVLSRAMILSEPGTVALDEHDIIRALSSQSNIAKEMQLPEEKTLASMMEDHEKYLLQISLKENNGHKVATADRLGISLRSLYYKLEKYKLI